MRVDKKLFLIILILHWFLIGGLVHAQTNDDKITEQKAFQYFQEKNYSEALPLFSQLLSLYPKDDRYNLHYAACLIETNQLIEKAIKYLQFADSKSNDPIIKYYLGRAYHLNYHFKEAIENYNAFQQLATSKLVKELQVEKLIEMCQNGLDLIKFISDLTVVDNRRIKSENYFYSYDLKEFDGKLVIKPKELKSSIDKKEEPVNMVIFLPNKSNVVYYGSYGNNKNNGRDIYRIERLPDGKWSKPENIGNIINTPYDEDYPFLHSDGKTLYFSSKGHNSMGGYDIFKSEFDSTAMTWTKPINLDFPINTPYDDYLYITDKDNFYAYFTSNRETRDNNITVYKIIVDKNPIKREFKDIEEIINVARLETSSIAAIKKAEESKQKNKSNEQNIIFASNENNNNNITISPYNFKPISYSPNLTSQEVANNLKADNEKILKNANEIKRQSQLAYIKAKETNEKANQKRKEAYEKNAKIKTITDPVEAEQAKQEVYQLINDAEELERQAITAYNVAQNFEQIANEMEKDVAKSQNFINAIEKQGTVDEAIVDAANKNKERLELSQNKYSSLQKAYEERKTLQKNKENELATYEQLLNNTSDSITLIDEQIKQIETKMANSNSETEKNYLSLQLDELNKRNDFLDAKQVEIAELIEKTKIDIENLNSENQFLNEFAQQVSTDNRSYEELSKENITKDQLKKDIFDKELSADIAVAQTVKEKVGQKNKNNTNTKNNNSLTPKNNKSFNNITPNTNTTNTVSNNINQPILQNNTINTSETNQNNPYVIKGVNPLIPNSTITNSATVENIEKEQFNVQYYTNIVNEQQKKLEIINNAINKTRDKKEKQLLEQQKSYLTEELQSNKNALNQSQQKIAEYKKALANKVDTAMNYSNEELILQASKYENKYEINFTLAQKQQLANAVNIQNELKQKESKLFEIAKEIKRLETIKTSLNNNADQKATENDINKLKLQQSQLFREYTNMIDKSNNNTIQIYDQIINNIRNYNVENPEVKTAILVEKEIEALKEKSSQLKQQANLVQTPEDKINLYKKANIIDQIAIQKQKYAIDLYVSSRQNIAQVTQTNNDSTTTSNTNNNSIKTKETISVELTPEENKQIVQYQSQIAKAENKLNQGKSLYQEIEEKRQLASKTYSNSKKKEILKDVDKKEQEAVQLLIEAHNMYEKANQQKHDVYHNKVTQLLNNENVIEDNKTIAIQFLKEADFYYNEAQQVRLNSKAAATNEDKIALLNKAMALEQKAINNLEYALDAITQAEPVEFVATNNLTKIDKLEALDNPVNVDEVIRIKTERVIANLNLSEIEKQALDDAIAKHQTINQLITEAEKYESKLNLAKEMAQHSTNKSEKKKAEKSIPKLEKEYFSRKFTAAELTENVNDAYYKLYESKFTEIRPKDKSEETKQGKQLEKNANKLYIQAKQLREKSFITENPYIAYNYLLQADSLEKSAIEQQEKAFGLYLKLKPLEEEIKEYAEKHPKKQSINELIVIKTPANVTPITKDELAQIEQENAKKNKTQNTNDNAPQNLNINNENNNEKNEILAQNPTNNQQDNPPQNQNINNENNNEKNEILAQNPTNNQQDNPPQNQNINNENNNEKNEILAQNPTNNQQDNPPQNLNINNENNNEKNEILAQNPTNNQQDNPAQNQNINNENNTDKNKILTENLNNKNEEILHPEDNEINTNTSTTKTNQATINKNASIVPTNITTPMGFSFMPTSPYNEANPIPINPPLPQGLVFKVQIGAFNTPVKPNAFTGLSPVSAEKLEGSKYYRYFVGMFYSEAAAIMVRDYVRPMGYKDAFVVAFYNGKRISLFEARQIIKQSSSSEYEQIVQNEAEKIKMVTSVAPNIAAINAPNNLQNKNVNAQPVLGTLVNNTQELFYTVQIGVYKTPVTHASLKNLTPLYEDHAYNFIRYLVGKFNNRKDAENEKNKIVALGITDAFVSAYYKGQKITLAEAANIEAMNPNAVIQQSDVINTLPTTQNTYEPVNVNNVANININNLFYRVQIGSFKEKVPFDIAAKFVQISSQYGIDQQLEDGATIYYAGKFKTYNEALQCKNNLLNQGFSDAFIIATDGKQRISVKQAKELLNQ
ncbi:MAG: PD40 domain-containing protein [Bacteroidales bacterium]|nr:PD40 domain-containing protein [Bacteroidales bacterium]